jgi:hypothetical protein
VLLLNGLNLGLFLPGAQAKQRKRVSAMERQLLIIQPHGWIRSFEIGLQVRRFQHRCGFWQRNQ